MKIFAHRGASRAYPENTLPAFEAAERAGADGIELDVQLSLDGEIVVFHDDTLERCTRGEGRVRMTRYEEILELSDGRVPLLSEVLDFVSSTRLLLNVELKGGAGLEEKVLQEIRAFELQERVLFSSFNLFSCLRMKRLAPELPCGYLRTRGADFHPGKCCEALGLEYYHPGAEELSREVVEACHERGIGVHVWTVDEEALFKKLSSWGVEGIFTNVPEKFCV